MAEDGGALCPGVVGQAGEGADYRQPTGDPAPRASERGFQVPPDLVFVDDGYSGARLDRPALDRLRDLAAEGGLAAVLIAAPDRLARHYAYQVLLLEELARAGCETIFLNHAFDASPEPRMLLQMQGVLLGDGHVRCPSEVRWCGSGRDRSGTGQKD
jgi:hypothetical protein